MKLFAVLLGGRAAGCNVELHDVVFISGNTLEETYPKLIQKWFGDRTKVHIDSSVELKYVDGYEIVLSHEKPAQDRKLYFVNFGGYKKDYFGEIHEINFYVADSKEEAKARAKKELCLNTLEQHCDDHFEIDDIICLDKSDQWYIHLLPAQSPQKMQIQSVYRKLNVAEILA